LHKVYYNTTDRINFDITNAEINWDKQGKKRKFSDIFEQSDNFEQTEEENPLKRRKFN